MKTHCQCPISASRLHRLSSSPGQHGVSKPATMSKGHPSSSSKVSGPRRMTPVEDAQSVEKRRRRLPAERFFGGISAAPSTNSQPAHRRSRGRTGKRRPTRPLHFVLRNFVSQENPRMSENQSTVTWLLCRQLPEFEFFRSKSKNMFNTSSPHA